MWLALTVWGCARPAPEDPRLARELEALRVELATLRSRVDGLTEARPASTPAPAPPTEPAAVRAQRREVEGGDAEAAAQDAAQLAEAVDEDLGSLEATVEAQAAALAEARQAIAELTTIVNNHADLLDGQAEDLATLDRDTQLVRDMQGMVSVQDGQLRIEDANLVLIQGADADGKPRENGRILTQPAVLAGR